MPRRILIVDDDPEVRQGLAQVLGYVPDVEVVAVPGVAQGRTAGLEGSWDLIISDEQMPDGRGSELLDELRRQRPGPHQVLMSGFRDFDMLLRGVNAAHIDHFFQKPYDPMQVLEYVQRILRDREGPAAAARPPRESPFRRLGAWGRPVEPTPHRAAPPLPGAPPTPPGPKVAPRPIAAPPPPAAPLVPRAPPAAPATAPAPAAPAAASVPAVALAPPAPRPPPPAAAPASPAPPAPAPEPAVAKPDPNTALARTIEEGLVDLELCLRWAREAANAVEKLRHVRMAQRRLEDTARNLETLTKPR